MGVTEQSFSPFSASDQAGLLLSETKKTVLARQF
jgi:hypothetical protein